MYNWEVNDELVATNFPNKRSLLQLLTLTILAAVCIACYCLRRKRQNRAKQSPYVDPNNLPMSGTFTKMTTTTTTFLKTHFIAKYISPITMAPNDIS
jgi:hypothetical protein